jgi:hypothetical protein
MLLSSQGPFLGLPQFSSGAFFAFSSCAPYAQSLAPSPVEISSLLASVTTGDFMDVLFKFPSQQ